MRREQKFQLKQLKEFPQPMLSSWVLHRTHIYQANMSSLVGTLYMEAAIFENKISGNFVWFTTVLCTFREENKDTSHFASLEGQ
jgi:hypothetical protein